LRGKRGKGTKSLNKLGMDIWVEASQIRNTCCGPLNIGARVGPNRVSVDASCTMSAAQRLKLDTVSANGMEVRS
jgi:hypothetical protein